MLPFNLDRMFRRPQNATPFPRGLVSFQATAAAAANHPKLGVFASVGAIALGGMMMIANIKHERVEAPVALAPVTPAIKAPEIAKAQPAPLAPAPNAASADAVPSSPAVIAKSTARVDMTPTGAIATEPATKLRHKPHPKKNKTGADNHQ